MPTACSSTMKEVIFTYLAGIKRLVSMLEVRVDRQEWRLILMIGFVNNVMRYNFSSGNWAYIKGSATTNSIGFQETMGFESETVNPPSLAEFVGAWDPINRMYYVLTGYSTGSPQEQDAVFRYNVATNAWTHLSGNFKTTIFTSNLGIKRRGVASGYFDQANRYIYLYGGWNGVSHAGGKMQL